MQITVTFSEAQESSLNEVFGDHTSEVLATLLNQWVAELAEVPSTQDAIAALARTGRYTTEELALRFGVSQKTIGTSLARAGVSLREVRRNTVSANDVASQRPEASAQPVEAQDLGQVSVIIRPRRVYIDEAAWAVEEATLDGLLIRRVNRTMRLRFDPPGYAADEIITTDEAARILSITPVHLMRLLRAGRVPGHRTGKRWELRRDEVEALKGQQWKARKTGRPMMTRPPGRPSKLSPGVAQLDVHIDEVVAAYEAGGTLNELAARFSVSRETVRQRLRAVGVDTRHRDAAWKIRSARLVAETVQLYSAGQSIDQIAERFQVEPSTVKRRLKEGGVEINPMVSSIADQLVEARQAYEGGASLSALAERYSLSAMTVRRHLMAAGTEMRRPGAYNATPLPDSEIIRLYKDGQSLARIADQFGVSAGTVRQRLVKAGVGIRQRPGRVSVQPVEARQAYEGGASLSELADRYSVSTSTLRQRLIEAGVELRPGGKKLLPVEEMAQLYEDGHSLAYIAEQCGVSATTVKQRLIQANVEVRSASEQARIATRLPLPIEESLRLYQDGYSMSQIADQFGVSVTTVQRRFAEENVETRPGGRPRKPQVTRDKSGDES